ncbi:MAG: alpha/beta fold hydrolase [Polyangiaceae bacterium]
MSVKLPRSRARLVAIAMLVVLFAWSCDRPREPDARRARDPRPPPSASAGTAPLVAPSLDAVVRLTAGAGATDELPLIVALHGLGDTPESFGQLFREFPSPARVVMLRAPAAYGSGFSWFPYRPDATDAERAAAFAPPAKRVAETIAVLEQRYPTHGKAILTGFSQGGMLSFTVAAQHPRRIAAAFPLGGLMPPQLLPSTKSAELPHVVALHGQVDDRVSPTAAKSAVDALKSRGYDARFQAFPAVGHSISAEMRVRLFELIQAEIERQR